MDALTRRMGQQDAGGHEQILHPQPHILILEEHDMQPVDGIDISNWEKTKAGLWIVPAESRLAVLSQFHDSGIAGHWGHDRTRELISRNFTWEGCMEDINHYVATYIKCQKAKSDRHSKKTKLQPMPIGCTPFQEIAMDFVGELPLSEEFNAILVITCRFSKYQIYIPAKTTWTSEDVANAYLCEVWKLFGLPQHVTSDRGPQFASAFTRALNKKLDVGLHLSTAHHPQTDGLTERAIQTLKQFLRIYCHDRQERWRRWLPLAQFAYNSTAHSSHGYTPFTSAYGWNPRAILVNNEDMENPAAEDWLERMTRVHAEINSILMAINDRRSSLSLDKARSFTIGDWVLVDRCNLTIKAGNNRSLTNKYIGPFKVIARKGSHAYKLNVPARMRLHHTIHVSLLKPFYKRGNKDEKEEDKMQVDDDDENLYAVEKIINSRRFASGVKYLIRWEGYTKENDSWEPMESLCSDGIKQLLVEFHKNPANKRKAIHPHLEHLI